MCVTRSLSSICFIKETRRRWILLLFWQTNWLQRQRQRLWRKFFCLHEPEAATQSQRENKKEIPPVSVCTFISTSARVWVGVRTGACGHLSWVTAASLLLFHPYILPPPSWRTHFFNLWMTRRRESRIWSQSFLLFQNLNEHLETTFLIPWIFLKILTSFLSVVHSLRQTVTWLTAPPSDRLLVPMPDNVAMETPRQDLSPLPLRTHPHHTRRYSHRRSSLPVLWIIHCGGDSAAELSGMSAWSFSGISSHSCGHEHVDQGFRDAADGFTASFSSGISHWWIFGIWFITDYSDKILLEKWWATEEQQQSFYPSRSTFLLTF